MHDDFAFEPIRGLPSHLPKGESLLWQGAPDWKAVAYRIFHVRAVAAWGVAMVLWRFVTVLQDGGAAIDAIVGSAMLAVIMATPVALLAAIAWGMARTTVYSITTRRVVLRIGMALTVSLNLPYKRIESADLKLYKDGSGSIALRLKPDDSVSYAVLWPHCRPWMLGRAEPMLRLIPEARAVAALLVDAMTDAIGDEPVRLVRNDETATGKVAVGMPSSDRPMVAARAAEQPERRPMTSDIEFAAGD